VGVLRKGGCGRERTYQARQSNHNKMERPAQGRAQENVQNAQVALNLSAGRFRKSLNQNWLRISGREKSANLSAAPPAANASHGIRRRNTVMADGSNCCILFLTQLTQLAAEQNSGGRKPFAIKNLRRSRAAAARDKHFAVLIPDSNWPPTPDL
jgi:hypothetical protein